MSEQLCLQWNDFKENVNETFRNLREDEDFSDVTLVCEDGHQVKGHKVVLASSSPFFNDLLVQNKHPHPMIYMRGVKSVDLKAILDFLYLGEANVFQEDLNSFLAIAAELKLQGLIGGEDKLEEEQATKMEPSFRSTQSISSKKEDKKEKAKIEKSQREEKKGDRRLAVANDVLKYTDDLDARVNSMMEQSQNLVPNGKEQFYRGKTCKVCGKEGSKVNIRGHIEANHLEGVCLPCDMCEKTFRSRNTLRMHIRSCHKY